MIGVLTLSSALAGSVGVDDRVGPAVDPVLQPTVVHLVPQVPTLPPSNLWSVLDYEDIVLVRPIGDAVSRGFGIGEFDWAITQVLEDRKTAYDFAMVLETDDAPSQFVGAAAFYLPMNNGHHQGTGNRVVIRPDRPLYGALWMSSVSAWTSRDPAFSDWVFGQELGHFWLAFPQVDHGEGPETLLLGRGNSHWSYFHNTGASPMEGNRWRDNGDGTFTSEPEAGLGGFSDLDLYMMGMLDPSEVAPFWVIDPAPGTGIDPGFPPDALLGSTPRTVEGTRIDLTIEDVIAAEGPVAPNVSDAPRDFRLLTLLVVGPQEVVTLQQLDDVRALQRQWAAVWSTQTRGLSTVDFTLTDEGRSPPPLPDLPTLVPRGAW